MFYVWLETRVIDFLLVLDFPEFFEDNNENEDEDNWTSCVFD